MSLSKRLGQNLREARLRGEPPMSSVMLAARAGCSPALVSRIEAGTVSPSIGTLGALADALHVSAAELLEHDGPTRRATVAIATARTILLLGRTPDLGGVQGAIQGADVRAVWRARGYALIAIAAPPGPMATAAAVASEECLAAGSAPTESASIVLQRARLEVAHAVGEAAWARGDASTAARRWGNGLALPASTADIESLWTRATIARSLARVTPGTRTAENALAIAIESLVAITDPATVAARLLATPHLERDLPPSLALAIVSASQVALADARGRVASLRPSGSAVGVPTQPDMTLGRHLR